MQLDDLIPSKPKLSEKYIPSVTPCKFVTGPAGTGKTYQQKEAIKEDPCYGILTATTGIAAINLGATTLNSVLKYYDTESLRDRLNRGTLTATLHRLGKKIKKLVIDEISMMDRFQLEYIHQALEQVNSYADMQPDANNPRKGPMGIVLTGDFCQLPPVKAEFVFKADCWEHFERNTDTLSKIWRQDNLDFLTALNAARAGNGGECVEYLKKLGVRFVPQTTNGFPGTTILPKNTQVDNYNFSQLLTVKGNKFTLPSVRWGDQSGEWKIIPDNLALKDGAYVMILSNDSESGEFRYANGDCGHIVQRDEDGTIWVKLVRTDKDDKPFDPVPINPIIRYKTISHEDGSKMGLSAHDAAIEDYQYEYEDQDGNEHTLNTPRAIRRMAHIFCEKECGWDTPGRRHGAWGIPSYNCSSGTFNIGAVKFYPLRLAYATSVHKSQGLTLDACQIDCRDPFFGDPGMAYVALSRCRTANGLTIVGDPSKLEQRINVNPQVVRWL